MAQSTQGTFRSTRPFPVSSRRGPDSWWARPAPLLVDWSGRLFAEGVLATLLSALVYVLLRSEIQVDDVNLYAQTLRAGRYEWSVLHLLMQPAALFWHQLFGRDGDVIASMEQINLLGAAIGIGVFHVLLCRLGTALPLRLLTTALAVFSFNFLALAPTAHIKMILLPPLMAALYSAVIWEAKCMRGGALEWRSAIYSSFWLGVAIATMISSVVIVPFACLAILYIVKLRYDSYADGMRLSCVYASVAGSVALIIFLIGFLLSDAHALSMNGLIDFFVGTIIRKNNVEVYFVSVPDLISRLIYSTVYNFVYTPNLGPIIRAWQLEQIPDISEYYDVLLIDVILFVVTAIIIVGVLAFTVFEILRRSPRAVVMSLAFLVGALVYGAAVNLNDPEHWFQITGPFLILFVQLPFVILPTVVGVVWLSLLCFSNLGGYGIPRAQYPLARREAEVRNAVGANDLLVMFSAYPGRPDISLFRVPDVPQLRIDLVWRGQGRTGADEFFQTIGQRIDSVLDRNGKVLVVRVLDKKDWDSPWVRFYRKGISKASMHKFFHDRYEITPLPVLAGEPAWELRHKSPVQ